MNAYEGVEVFGPSPETYAFVVVAALPIAAMIVPWLHGNQPTRDLVMATGVALFVLYCVRAFQFTLSSESLRYRSPFGRPPLVRWSSITRVRTGARSPRAGYPPYFMEIHTDDRDRPVVINLKFFSRKALSRLGTVLAQRAAQAHRDRGTQHLAGGVVPSLFSKAGTDDEKES